LSDYRIFETEQFQEDLKKNLGPRQEKLTKKLNVYVYPRLKTQPYFGKNIRKLRGFKPETWRYRIGPYRFFYEVDEEEKIIFMIAAETRQESY
jgi:mRNA interferase RelE/StbE